MYLVTEVSEYHSMCGRQIIYIHKRGGAGIGGGCCDQLSNFFLYFGIICLFFPCLFCFRFYSSCIGANSLRAGWKGD